MNGLNVIVKFFIEILTWYDIWNQIGNIPEFQFKVSGIANILVKSKNWVYFFIVGKQNFCLNRKTTVVSNKRKVYNKGINLSPHF